MSRFLRASVIRDRVDDIIEASAMLLGQIREDDEKVRDLALDLAEIARDLKEFVSRWECEPLIYTGRGTTEEVIGLLDSLLAEAERATLRTRRLL